MRLGETYVHGRDSGTARRLLAAADKVGQPPFVVRATETGFIVPDAVWDEVAGSPPEESEEF